MVKGTNNKGQNVQLYLNMTADLNDLTIKTKNKRKQQIQIVSKLVIKYLLSLMERKKYLL